MTECDFFILLVSIGFHDNSACLHTFEATVFNFVSLCKIEKSIRVRECFISQGWIEYHYLQFVISCVVTILRI